MEKQTIYKIETAKDKLRLTAGISALAALILALAFLYIWIPILLPVILGIFFAGVAWMVSWMGGPLMAAWAVLFLVQLPHSNWGILRQLPFYIALSVFLASGMMFMTVAVLDWITHKKASTLWF